MTPMSGLFHITDVNPNDGIGGGGTICNGDSAGPDCKAPFAVFYSVETDNNLSPHVVLCLGCAEEFVSRAKALTAVAVDSSAIELPEGDEPGI